MADRCANRSTHRYCSGQIKPIGDMERILTRVNLGSASPRDIGKLRDALSTLPEVKQVLAELPGTLNQRLIEDMGDFGQLHRDRRRRW